MVTLTVLPSSETLQSLWYDGVRTGTLRAVWKSALTEIESCNVGTKPTSGNWFVAKATAGKWFMCPVGTTAAAIPADQSADKFCEGIAANYYGTKGNVASAHAKQTGGGATDRPTACTTTFSDTTKDTATGITSAASPATTTDKTACKTKPGYIITSAVNAADGDITVEKAGSGTYAAGGTALVTADGANKGTAKQTANACPYGGTTTATGQDAVTDCTPKCGSGTNAEANTGTCRCKADYYGTPLDANDAQLAVVTKGCTACPSSANAAAGSTAIESCNVGTKPTSGNWFVAAATAGKWFMCPEGTTAAAVPANQSADKFCEGIAANYYGTKGNVASAHAKQTGG